MTLSFITWKKINPSKSDSNDIFYNSYRLWCERALTLIEVHFCMCFGLNLRQFEGWKTFAGAPDISTTAAVADALYVNLQHTQITARNGKIAHALSL